MSLLSPHIIVPDTSHWANWIDAAYGTNPVERSAAENLHKRLMIEGRIPLLSWHHLEELLGTADDAKARRRIAFLQALPLVAFFRSPSESEQIGSIIDIHAAEVSAILSGARDLVSVKKIVKAMLLRTGSGIDAIGDEAWIWEVIRPAFLERREKAKLITSTARMGLFDDARTVGEIARGRIRTQTEMKTRLATMRVEVATHVRTRGDRKIMDHQAVSDEFMTLVENYSLPTGTSVRELIVLALTSQGLDEDEIHDDCTLSDLNQLALFRAKLKVVAEKLGRPFGEIKNVRMEDMPSWQIDRALGMFGQDRVRRSGSDLVDGYLATLAPYVDELFVDKRTAEDFRRVKAQDLAINPLLCKIRKSARFESLADAG